MNKHLKLLIIEDSEPDTLLLVREVRQHGYDVEYQCVKNAEDFSAALQHNTWDMIISDYSIPNFGGLKALEILKQKSIDIPFLMLSGVINEDLAGGVLNAGANDFFAKGKLARLVPAIERELREAEKRRLHRQTELRLFQSEERFIKAFQANPLAIMICTLADDILLDANNRFLELLQYDLADIIQKPITELSIWAEDYDHDHMLGLLDKYSRVRDFETQFYTRDKRLIDVLISIELIELSNQPCMLAMIRDITERKQVEKAEQEQRILAEALRETSLSLNTSLELSQVLDFILDNVGKVVEYDAANIMLQEGDRIKIVRTRGYKEAEQFPESTLVEALPHLKTVFETKQSVIISEVASDIYWGDFFEEFHVKSHITVPIIVDDQTSGLINLDSYTPRFFSPTHLHGLEIFASQAGIAIQNAQLYQRAQELAIIEERQRLANDLHDAVSQMLFTSCIIADSLPRYFDRDLETVRSQLEQLKRLNRGALAEMRKLLLEFHSEMLGEVDIEKLLQQLAQAAMGHTQIDVDLEMKLEVPLPSSIFQIEIYRIVQEALNNIVKHAHAKHATVRLVCANEHGELSIEDDGLGFDSEKIPPGHMGLSIMKSRTDRLGAFFEVISRSDGGTKITVTWNNTEILNLPNQRKN